MSDAPTDTIAPGTVISDRYRVEELLGQGAMGAVYRVEHVHMRKRMALKVLLPEVSANAEVVARFEREAMAAAHIDHPNVVAATDFGRTPDGAFFLVLEYVEGQSLREVLTREAPLDPRRAAAIGAQIASALARAHGLGVVHRDLKPDNVMIVQREGQGEVIKVLDFGIAKVSGLTPSRGEQTKALTQIGAVFGTPEYMAPEQAMGQTVDARADLYALGICLYEMLTGTRPFESDNPIGLLTMHVTTAPTPPSVRKPGIPLSPAFEALVLRLLAKTPEERPASAQEVESALLVEASGVPSGGAAAGSSPSLGRVATVANRQASDPSLSIAKTSLAGATDVPLAPIVPTRIVATFEQVVRDARVKRAAPFVGGGLAVLFVGWLVLKPSADTHGRDAHAQADGGAVAAASASSTKSSWLPSIVSSKVSDSKLADGIKTGPVALFELEREYPKDARIPRELVRAFAAQGKMLDALAALGRLAQLDPAAAADTEMLKVVDAALDGSDNDAADAALSVLEGPLGARGVDLLLERANEPGRSKARAQRSLKKPEVRAHASPAAAITLDLRDAKNCDARKDLLARAQQVGDARTLAILNTFKRTRGCGFMGLTDCFRCMRGDSELDDTIAALEAKK